MKNKFKISGLAIKAGCIIAALAAAVSVFLVMLETEKNMLEAYEKKTVCIASDRIHRGQVINEKNFDIYMTKAEFDADCVPETAIYSAGQMGEMAAVWDIQKGVLLTEGMFETVKDITKEMQRPVIAGFKADDLYQVTGGVLRSGDRINIYVEDENGIVNLMWNNIYVQQVFDSSGAAIASDDLKTAAQRINVYIDEGDAETFYTGLGANTVRVVKLLE